MFSLAEDRMESWCSYIRKSVMVWRYEKKLLHGCSNLSVDFICELKVLLLPRVWGWIWWLAAAVCGRSNSALTTHSVCPPQPEKHTHTHTQKAFTHATNKIKYINPESNHVLHKPVFFLTDNRGRQLHTE